MTFKTRKDFFVHLIIFGFSAIFITMVINNICKTGLESTPFFWSDVVLLVVTAFLLWIYFGTQYEITNTHVIYKSGPIRGGIEIEDITEVIKNKTLWSGIKPATATKGLIIKYGYFDEIYISPKTNDTFVNKLLEIKPDIKVIEG